LENNWALVSSSKGMRARLRECKTTGMPRFPGRTSIRVDATNSFALYQPHEHPLESKNPSMTRKLDLHIFWRFGDRMAHTNQSCGHNWQITLFSLNSTNPTLAGDSYKRCGHIKQEPRSGVRLRDRQVASVTHEDTQLPFTLP
jgi:hypothetical protein